MNEAERKKTEISKGFGAIPIKTKRLTKKIKKVYAESASIDEIIKNKAIKHQKVDTDNTLRHLRKWLAKNG